MKTKILEMLAVFLNQRMLSLVNFVAHENICTAFTRLEIQVLQIELLLKIVGSNK